MTLSGVMLVTVAVVAPSLVATCVLCTDGEQVRASLDDLGATLVDLAPYLGVVLLFSVFKHLTSRSRLALSKDINWNITDTLYALEGRFVAELQAATPDVTYGFFTGMYVFGFPYLLVVPPVMYFLTSSERRLKEILVAYVLNHAVGVVCYTLFIAYGPRNWIPTHVDGIMYELYPWTQEITAAVSAKTNVFPSLHTSLSVVALLFAWRTRRTYPRWFYVAAFTAVSVLLSTMVLGIHWLTDILAGIVLGTWSVLAAEWIVARVGGIEATTRREPRNHPSD
jgi:membrane-associated phospholipid phosphatase